MIHQMSLLMLLYTEVWLDACCIWPSRPDIAFSVGVCSRFQSNTKVSHLNAVKRIIKYVGGTYDYGLFYSKESNLSLAGFSDSDWAGNADDRKSTTGGIFM